MGSLSEPLVTLEDGAPHPATHSRRRGGYACRPEGRGDEDRLLDRSVAFAQSKGKLRIAREHNRGRRGRRLYYRDLYHTIADSRKRYILLYLVVIYLAVSVLFGFLWWAASEPRDAGQETGDSTSLQRGCSGRTRSRERIHCSRTPREMIARPKMSQNESKTTEIRGFKKLDMSHPFPAQVRRRHRIVQRRVLVFRRDDDDDREGRRPCVSRAVDSRSTNPRRGTARGTTSSTTAARRRS